MEKPLEDVIDFRLSDAVALIIEKLDQHLRYSNDKIEYTIHFPFARQNCKCKSKNCTSPSSQLIEIRRGY